MGYFTFASLEEVIRIGSGNGNYDANILAAASDHRPECY